ncbi:MAG: hypothetical protein R8K48_01025 [Gallionella sp.]
MKFYLEYPCTFPDTGLQKRIAVSGIDATLSRVVITSFLKETQMLFAFLEVHFDCPSCRIAF